MNTPDEIAAKVDAARKRAEAIFATRRAWLAGNDNAGTITEVVTVAEDVPFLCNAYGAEKKRADELQRRLKAVCELWSEGGSNDLGRTLTFVRREFFAAIELPDPEVLAIVETLKLMREGR